PGHWRWLSTRLRRWCCNGWSASRWAMKTSTTTMNCGTIRCWRCWLANSRRSGRIARRWRGRPRRTRWGRARPPPPRHPKVSHDPAAIEALFVEVFLEAHRRPPAQITLDLDATDDPLHGHQEGRFFHGYYDCYCYLPLYIFCGRHLLAARLRRSNIDGAAGAI